MSSIQQVALALQQNLNAMMSNSEKVLYRADVSGDKIWEMYMSSFTEEHDPIFRCPESSSHNCNHCKNFIRRYGNIVALDGELTIMSLFTNIENSVDEEYHDSIRAMEAVIQEAGIGSVFVETKQELINLPYEKTTRTQTEWALGVANNVKRYTKEEAELYPKSGIKTNQTIRFHHMHVKVQARFLFDRPGKSAAAISSEFNDRQRVFKRACRELRLDSLELVKDLIVQGSLLDATEKLGGVEAYIGILKTTQGLSDRELEHFAWHIAATKTESFCKFKNSLMGVFCTELSEGMEINKACQNWNKRVDPVNYKKVKSPITEKQKQAAEKFVVENGYVESFNRRIATMEDIRANQIKHMNVGDGKVEAVSMFDNVPTKSTAHKRAEFEKVEEVSIDKFMSDILPGCTSIEAWLDNKHEGNLAVITTAASEDSKPIFKWDNNLAATYKGNLAGKSQLRDAVKASGGSVSGVLRFSLGWAEGDPSDDSDLDAHAKEPDGFHIHYGRTRNPQSGGNLDLDITRPSRQRPGHKNVVENITWPTLGTMQDGEYLLYAHNYADRGNKGFTAEIAMGDEVFNYEYKQRLSGSKKVATVTLKNGQFTIKHHMEASNGEKELWGIKSQNFHKVNLVCLSPNHWGKPVGNKQYFFMLDKCKTDTPIRGFHNVDLIDELGNGEHRKTMDILGNFKMIEPSDNQLAGLGFNATVRDELIVKLQGSFKRMLKIKF